MRQDLELLEAELDEGVSRGLHGSNGCGISFPSRFPTPYLGSSLPGCVQDLERSTSFKISATRTRGSMGFVRNESKPASSARSRSALPT